MMASLVISIVSLLVALASAFYAWRSAKAAEASAEVARDQHRRERQPRLRIRLAEQASATDDTVIYHVVNDAPGDLDSVQIHKPETPDLISHSVAAIGAEWADVAELGKLGLGEETRFALSIGTRGINDAEPVYRVRIVCRRGTDMWEEAQELEAPRYPLGIL